MELNGGLFKVGKVLDYCAKSLGFVGHGNSLEFVFLWDGKGLCFRKTMCFSNMTNIMRVGTKTLEVWREEELQNDYDLGIHIRLLVSIKRRIYLLFKVNLSHSFISWTTRNIKQLITDMHVMKIEFSMQ